MIGKLKGIVDSIEHDHVILDVGGVGYVVFASLKTLGSLPMEKERATLLIDTHVREDHIHLYGFASIEEQQAFRILLKVNGVGTKMALAILSTLHPTQITTAIVMQDKAAFQQISGIGPKLAVRLITELKDAFNIHTIALIPHVSNTPAVEAIKSETSTIADAVSALVNLGYNHDKAYNAITRAFSRNKALPLGELIREGLKELSAA